MLRKLIAAGLFSLGALSGSSAFAQPFPSKTVTLIVPFAPGGATDVLARLIAGELAKKWGQAVVVDNKPGGNTVIATQAAARASADGYTAMLATFAWVTNPVLMKSLPYDNNALVPVAHLGSLPQVLYIRADIPATTVPELAEYVRKSGKPLSIANAGTGSTPHLSAVQFANRSGIPTLDVPYKGMSPAANDVMGGQVDAMFEGATYRQHVDAKKMNALLIGQGERLASWPKLAPAADAGLPGFDSAAWFLLMLPAKTPMDVQQRYFTDVNAILAQPDIQAQLLKLGILVRPKSLAQVAVFVEQQRQTLGAVIQKNNIKLD